MEILIVEDNSNRIASFQQMLKGANLDVTKDTKQAIEWLKHNQYDVILLDHDLGDEVFVASGEGTGWEVAKWIADNHYQSDVIVHSWNTAGARNIKAILPNALLMPYNTVQYSIVDGKLKVERLHG